MGIQHILLNNNFLLNMKTVLPSSYILLAVFTSLLSDNSGLCEIFCCGIFLTGYVLRIYSKNNWPKEIFPKPQTYLSANIN